MSELTNQDIRDTCATCVPEMDGVAYGFAGMCLILLRRHDALERDLADAQQIIKDHESGVENLNRTMRGLMDDLAAAQAEVEEWKLLSARETTVLTNECNRLRAESAVLRKLAEAIAGGDGDACLMAKQTLSMIDQARKEGS